MNVIVGDLSWCVANSYSTLDNRHSKWVCAVTILALARQFSNAGLPNIFIDVISSHTWLHTKTLHRKARKWDPRVLRGQRSWIIWRHLSMGVTKFKTMNINSEHPHQLFTKICIPENCPLYVLCHVTFEGARLFNCFSECRRMVQVPCPYLIVWSYNSYMCQLNVNDV